jgi:hypothetical protein
MFQDAFEKLDSSQADVLLKEVNPRLDGSAFDASTATIMVHNLSFYPGVPIFLDTNSVIEYVRFFFNYIRGRHGRFIVIENVDDISWREEPPPAARKAIGKMLIPLQIYEVNEEGSFFLLVNMMFKDSLFKAKVQVKPNGRVELFDEELVIEDIPVEEDILG